MKMTIEQIEKDIGNKYKLVRYTPWSQLFNKLGYTAGFALDSKNYVVNAVPTTGLYSIYLFEKCNTVNDNEKTV